MTILRREKVTSAQAPQGMKITSLRGGNYCVRLVEKIGTEDWSRSHSMAPRRACPEASAQGLEWQDFDRLDAARTPPSSIVRWKAEWGR